MTDDVQEQPLVSAIIPVRNDAANLRKSVVSLRRSTYPELEIVVVDDASTDSTAEAASEMSVSLVRLDRQSGPAVARNQGAKRAAGELLFFVDADVCVHRDTVARIVETFLANPTVDAVFGAYDLYPAANNVMSQYKNLFHHFVHQGAKEEASTFWSGCGAIRKETFFQMGGFDGYYGRPCIEDIELGARMHAAGKRIILNRTVQVTHLKRWSLLGVIKSDFWDRGVPWTELMLRSGCIPNDLNLKFSQRLSAVLVVLVFLAYLVSGWYWPVLCLIAPAVLVSLELIDQWTDKRPLPALMVSCATCCVVALVCVVVARFQWAAVLVCAMQAVVLLINYKLYLFFAKEKGVLFSLLVVPLHSIYYLYSVAAFACGFALHVWKTGVAGLLPRVRRVN